MGLGMDIGVNLVNEAMIYARRLIRNVLAFLVVLKLGYHDIYMACSEVMYTKSRTLVLTLPIRTNMRA